MSSRPSFEEVFLNIAFEWSKRSTCTSRIAVGAVVVNNLNQVIASGYNGAPRGSEHCDEVGCMMDNAGHCIRSIHAETNAIIQCAQNGISTLGARVFVTHSPCYHCSKIMIQSGIKEIVYVTTYKDIEVVLHLLNNSGVILRRTS